MPLIGEPIVRQEDARLLRGRGRFVDDVHVDGMLHAALFRSSWPHGRIRSIDVAAAAALPGVVGVFTLPDFSAFLKPIRSRIAAMPGFENFLQLPLATDKVRYVGEPMALVVATSPYVAEDAVSLISAEIDELPPVLSWECAARRNHPHPRAVPAPIIPASASAAATRRRRSEPRLTCGARPSACSATPPCRWRRAGWSRCGTKPSAA